MLMPKKGVRVRQRDKMDCGAACLASVAAFYRLRLPVSRVRQLAGTQQQGTSLLGLQEAALQLGFQAKGVRADKTQPNEVPLPAIYHTTGENGLQHFVVLYRRSKRGMLVMDPATGKMERKKSSLFMEQWTGIVLLLVPGSEFRKGNLRIPTSKRFIELLSPHRSMMGQALIGAGLYTLLGLAVSIFVQKIVDFVLPDGNLRLLNLMGVAMLLILFVQQLAGYMKSLIALRTGQQIDVRLIMGYYRHLLRLPQSFFDGMRVGEIVSRINDALRIRFFVNDAALGILVNLMTAGFSLAAMMMYSWSLSLGVLAMIPVYGIIYRINDRLNARYQRQAMERSADLETQLVETVTGMSTLKQFTAEQWAADRTEKKCIPLMRSIYKGSRRGLQMGTVTEAATRLLTIGLLWKGSYAVINQTMTPGALLSFYALAEYFTAPLAALIGSNRVMQDALIAADRLFEIIDLELEERPVAIDRLPEGDIFFKALHFRYGPGKKVFQGLNCCMERGRTTAVLGESGSGKSTLAALLLRLYEPQEGGVFIGVTNLRQIDPVALRKQVGIVPQQTNLFQGTIIANIALGDPAPDLARIFLICDKLGLSEFIQQLPGQFDAFVSESGSNFSGGQRQRIALARAMYRNPEILILDEATASLDPDNERQVHAALDWYASSGRTILIIAHRLSTIRFCHNIILLEKGNLVASGTHQELMIENPRYANWWRLFTGGG